jgi:hypothetical protein
MGDNEPVKRRDLLSKPKLLAEGTPEEAQIALGWILNTQLLQILLPTDKFEAWSTDIRAIVLDRRATCGDLESTVAGRLNHGAVIIPLA